MSNKEANLWSANLKGANLQQANLKNARLDEDTVLPDSKATLNNGYLSKWTPDTDMSRFTNPEHPDFWQPHNREI